MLQSNPTAALWHKIMTEIWTFSFRTCAWHKRCREREHRILAEGPDNCKVSTYTLYRRLIVCLKLFVELFSKYYHCVVIACMLNYFLNNITVFACVLNYFVNVITGLAHVLNYFVNNITVTVSMCAELFCK